MIADRKLLEQKMQSGVINENDSLHELNKLPCFAMVKLIPGSEICEAVRKKN